MRFFDTRLGRCATLLALGGGVALYAQGTQTASATVTVVDKSGAPVVNARVRLTSPSMMAERTGVTNSSGVFVARLLPPGTYTIEVIRDGFQTTKDTRTIGIDQHYQPKIVLQPVGNTTVEVVATAVAAMDPTDVKTATNYDAKKIDELPTGRGPNDVALLTPGVTTGVGGRVQVRGAMTSGNLYLLDGQRVADNTYNTSPAHLIADSFEETQILTGAISAEYGEVDGGVINTVTKSGGNVFTGQFRANMSNDAWNAMRAMSTQAQRDNVKDKTNITYSYTLGGFIIKDRLWFHVSYYTAQTETAGQITASAYGKLDGTGAGAPYTTKSKSDYLSLKLTYQINEDHSVVATYTNNARDIDPRNYSAGEIQALAKQREESGIYNLSVRSLWTPALNTELRFGGKRQMIAAGPPDYDANDLTRSPIRAGGLYYNMSVFGGMKYPDDRNNQTANIKASYFANWYGQHELDFGFDYYKGTRAGINSQSVTDWTFYMKANGFNADTRQGQPDYAIRWFGGGAEAYQTTMGLYVNDKWKLENNLTFQIGFRFDNYKASANDTDATSGASGFSPRLGATYDVFGDQQWVLKASYCRYNAAVLEKITGSVSGAGSIGQERWNWNTALTGWRSLAEITNPTNYTTRAYTYVPTFNVMINPDMKAPTVDEIQLGTSYSLFTDKWGKGYFGATFVYKNWKNMMDFHNGNNPINTVIGPWGPEFTEYWDNNPLAERKYTGVELVADWTWKDLHIGANATFSTLEGNYEGEGTNSPATGQGLGAWMVMDGDGIADVLGASYASYRGKKWTMYDLNDTDPYGYLTGHTPLVAKLMADYSITNRWGRTAIGYIFSYESGGQFAHYRENRTTQIGLTPALGAILANADVMGPTWYQMKDNQATHGHYNASMDHDLAITHDFYAYKLAGYQLRVFAKLVMYNFFNHQQQLTWREPAFASATTRDAEWKENTTLPANQRRGAFASGDFNTPRQISLSVGLRF